MVNIRDYLVSFDLSKGHRTHTLKRKGQSEIYGGFPKGGDYTMIEYKGYIGVVDFDPEIDLFHGTVINTQDVITFYGASVTELRAEMQKSLEVYFQVCEEQGKTPDKPFSGTLTIETTPELYSRIALNAARRQLEINVYLQEVLEKVVSVD